METDVCWIDRSLSANLREIAWNRPDEPLYFIFKILQKSPFPLKKTIEVIESLELET